MSEYFELKTTMRDLSLPRQPTPTLQVMGDIQSTQKNVAQAAQRARAGDNEAAIALSRLSAHPLIALKVTRPDDASNHIGTIPDGVPNDSLYWLRLAAERGDSLAQLLYVNSVMTAARLGPPSSTPTAVSP